MITLFSSCEGNMELEVQRRLSSATQDFNGIQSVEQVDSKSVRISWSEVEEAKEYLVHNNGSLIKTISAPASDTIFDNLDLDSDYNFTVKVKDKFGAISSNSNGISHTTPALECPENYLYVDGDQSFGVSDFCVMKFEAKNNAGSPTSQASGFPWVDITQPDASAACRSLGTNYDLISNPEWMVLARTIENVPENWNSGVVGDGGIYMGQGDGNPENSLEVTDEEDHFNGTLETEASDWTQRRIHYLPSGELIWDLGGNVYEWADWTLGGNVDIGPTDCSSSLVEFSAFSCGSMSSADYMPSNPSFGSAENMGRIMGGSGGAPRRGGHWENGSSTGIFRLSLFSNQSSSDNKIGFRCVLRQ